MMGTLGLGFWIGAGPWCPEPGIPTIAVLDGPPDEKLGAGALVGGATHLVQIVEVMVLYTVDTVDPVSMTWLPPDVAVEVTGHVVR